MWPTVFALDELAFFARMGGLYIVLMGLALEHCIRALRVCVRGRSVKILARATL